jgi:predicted branched-subunit amino acid permease
LPDPKPAPAAEEVTNSEIKDGLKGGAIVALSSSPFAVLFGAVAADNGLSFVEAGLMSATVYAGASQLVGIELFGQQVPPWLIVLSILAVNFRHVLYSAALAPMFASYTLPQRLLAFFLLVDPQYAEAAKRTETGRPVGFPWYLAFAATIYVPWVVFSMLGAWFGSMLGDPRTFAIDVLLPIYFLGLVVGFRGRPGFYPVVLASMAGSVLAYYFVGSPWHVSIGAALGVLLATLLPPPTEPAPASEGH